MVWVGVEYFPWKSGDLAGVGVGGGGEDPNSEHSENR